MHANKGKIIIIFLMIALLFQTGCWDMREINEIGLVMAVGLDYNVDLKNYRVTIDIMNASGGSGKDNDSGSSSVPWVCSADGLSIFDAIRNLARVSSKRITWAHNGIIIVGESLARHDITPVLDFFTHNPELRMKTLIAVSKGDARNYLVANAGMGPSVGLSLQDMFRYSPLLGESAKSYLLDVYSSFTSDYSQMLISGIDMTKELLDTDQSNNPKENNTIALEGAAVFKKTKMIGWLTPEETRGLSWALNNTFFTLVTVDEDDNKYVSIETKEVKSKIISEIVNGLPNITVKITGLGKITEESCPTDMSIVEYEKKLGELVSEKITGEVQKGIERVQGGYESDVLGFAQIVKAQNNNEWENGLKDDWQETFPNIPVKIDVNIDIISSNLNQEPIRETKGK